MVERDLGGNEVWNRGAVPHAVVMGQVSLQGQSPIEEVQRRCDDIEALAKRAHSTAMYVPR
jgi:hypothetical protein